jgi:hypothetical protein
MTYSYYRLADGLLTGQGSSACDPPEGCGAVPGRIDHLSYRVVLVTDDQGVQRPVLVDYQPTAPDGDEWQTWDWDAQTRRYKSAPTLAALKRAANAPLLAELAALDLQIARPVGEVAQALALAEAPPAAALQRLQDINTSKAALRAQLLAINAAESAEKLGNL